MEKQNPNIISIWILWQFYEAPQFLFKIWFNYLRFMGNFFSVPIILKTFFSPWRHYNWQYPKFVDVQEFFNTLVSNTFSRILGATMRTVLLVMGIIFQIIVFLAGIVLILFWILQPFLILIGFLLLFIL